MSRLSIEGYSDKRDRERPSPLRLVVFMHSAQRAGGELSMTRLLLSLSQSGAEVIVLLATPDGPLVQNWMQGGMRVLACQQPWLVQAPLSQRKMQEAISRAKSWLQRLAPDVVLSNTSVLFAGACAAAELDLPLVVWCRGVVSNKLFGSCDLYSVRAYEQALYQMASVVAVPSQCVAHHVRTLGPGSPIEVIPNGIIPPSDWSALDTKSPKREFVMLCGPEPNKNIPLVIQAVGIVGQKHPEIPVILAHYGKVDSDAAKDLKKYVKLHQTQQRVDFRGPTDNIAEVYGRCFSVIVASHRESFSNVVLEGMAYGRAVISTRCGGPESLVLQGKTGILVPRCDPEAMAEAIMRLADDPIAARAMGICGRQRVEAKYSLDLIRIAATRLLRRALEESSSPGAKRRRFHALVFKEQLLLLPRVGPTLSVRDKSEVVDLEPTKIQPDNDGNGSWSSGEEHRANQTDIERSGNFQLAQEVKGGSRSKLFDVPGSSVWSKTRLAVFAHSSQVGGAEVALARLLASLNRDEVEITLLASREGPMWDKWREAGLQTISCPQPWFVYPQHQPFEMKEAVRRARYWLERLNPDAVISNTTVLYAGARAAAELGLPLVVWSHGVNTRRLFPMMEMSIARAYERSLYGMSSFIVAPTAIVAQHIKCSDSGANVHVMPNGVVLPKEWQPLDIVSSHHDYVMLCGAEENKNIKMVIEAIALMRQSTPHKDVRLIHYGQATKSAHDALMAEVRRHEVGQWVEFRGYTSNLTEAYTKAYAVIVASQEESFSCVALEGMAYGRPVVATRCGGPECLIEDGKTGMLIPRDDAQALAQAMFYLSSQPLRARAMGIAGRELVERRYQIKGCAANMMRTVQTAIQEAMEPSVANRRRGAFALGDHAMMKHQVVPTSSWAPPVRTQEEVVESNTVDDDRSLQVCRPLSQSRFYFLDPKEDGLYWVEVRLDLHRQPAKGFLVLSIFADQAGKELLRRVPGDLSLAIENGWFRFEFPIILNSRDRRLSVRFDLENPGTDTAVSLYECRSVTSKTMNRLGLHCLSSIAQLHCRMGYSS